MLSDINIQGVSYKIGGNTFDGQWVKKSATIFSSTTFSTTGTKTYTVSNYLPDDDYVYEVILGTYNRTGTKSGDNAKWYVRDIYATHSNIGGYVITRSSSSTISQCGILMPVQQINGVLTFNINVSDIGSSGTGECGLTLFGYRRLGGKDITITINPTPSDATVTFDKGTVSGNSVTVKSGSIVKYTVSKNGYGTKTDNASAYYDRTINVTLSQGIQMYGYNGTNSGTNLDAYLLGEMTTSAYCAISTNDTSYKITSKTGTIGASGSKIVININNITYTYTYNRKITVSGIDLFIYRDEASTYVTNEIAVKSDAAAGKNYILGNLVGIIHPSSANSSSFVVSNLTFNRKSSLDYVFTGE